MWLHWKESVDSQMLDGETWRRSISGLNASSGLGGDVSVSGWLGTSFLLLSQTEEIPKDQKKKKEKKVRRANYQVQA